jgi:uncharacterized membrane protein/ribosomal protein L40E
MEKTLSRVVEAFNNLKTRFQAGEISRQEFIDEMKKLRIKDDRGRFWMIGAQTGKWYYFDGKDWVQDEPPSQKGKKAICIYCGFENKLEEDVCARCGGNLGEDRRVCHQCGAKFPEPFLNCPKCGFGPGEGEAAKEMASAGLKEIKEVGDIEGPYVLRSVQPSSWFLFGGVLGLLVGILAGAFAGATTYFSKYLTFLPQSLVSLQGNLLGGAIYGLSGGLVGFLAFACVAFLKAVMVNFILSLVGGIKFKVQKASSQKTRRKKEEDKESDYGPGEFHLKD